MTNEEIIQRGQLINDETEPAQNTSERVGGVIKGIGQNLVDKDAAIAAEAARNGYYQCTVSDTTLAVTAPGFTLPAHGGNIRIKMSAPATGASTLNINGTGPKALLYNGAAVSSANTWEQNEIISVFYDPSGSGQYLASNSQGGGGKAEKIKYDNSHGLTAENVQSALDELTELAGESVKGEVLQVPILYSSIQTNKAISINQSAIVTGTGNNNVVIAYIAEPLTKYKAKFYQPSQAGNNAGVAFFSGNTWLGYHIGSAFSSACEDEFITPASCDTIYLFTVDHRDRLPVSQMYLKKTMNRSLQYTEGTNYANAVVGGININGGNEIASTTRIRTGYIDCKENAMLVSLKEGLRLWVVLFYNSESDSGYIGSYVQNIQSAVTTRLVIPEGYYVRLVLARIDPTENIAGDDLIKVFCTLLNNTSIGTVYDGLRKYRVTKKLSFEYNGISNAGVISNYWWGKKVKRTPKMIDVRGNSFININSRVSIYRQMVWYDSAFSFISREDIVPLTAGDNKIFVPDAACYCKIIIAADTTISTDLNEFPIYITGYGLDEVFNPRSADGYQKICVGINVANAASGSTDVQSGLIDTENLLPDYGLLALPSTYLQEGKPTRLIIYCHGAGVNYNSSDATFDVDDGCDPTYWLAQGYAVMDMGGSPFDDTMPHWYIPQAIQCYIAGYEWCLKNFNLCRDGVFLGGRSMGGGMVLDIITNSTIPVKAAFMVSPTCNFAHWFNAASVNGRNSVITRDALVGNVPSMSGNPVSSSAWAFLRNNFRNLARYVPMWRIIADLPNGDVMFADSMNIASGTAESQTEAAVYENLHAKSNVPIKFFVATSDTVAPYRRNAMYMYNMLCNGGCVTEMRIVAEGGHYPEFDSENNVTITLNDGTTMSASIIYIEALQFCMRYELDSN